MVQARHLGNDFAQRGRTVAFNSPVAWIFELAFVPSELGRGTRIVGCLCPTRNGAERRQGREHSAEWAKTPGKHKSSVGREKRPTCGVLPSALGPQPKQPSIRDGHFLMQDGIAGPNLHPQCAEVVFRDPSKHLALWHARGKDDWRNPQHVCGRGHDGSAIAC